MKERNESNVREMNELVALLNKNETLRRTPSVLQSVLRSLDEAHPKNTQGEKFGDGGAAAVVTPTE